MKKFKLFKLLLLGVVLITSIPQMWAADVCQNTIIYFDNSASNWNSNYTYFGINDTHCWYMNKVTNTKLYVHKRSDGTWGGYSNVRLMADAGDWNQGERLGGYSNLSANMDHYTDGYSNYGFGADYYYCIKPANGNNLASLSISGLGSASAGSVTPLNKTITVKAKVSENDGASYSETTSPATLTASSHKFTAYNSCASSQSLSNNTITCGYTATTTLTAPSTDPSGYIFVGWYDSDGNEKTTGKTLTIYPTANATYYAYYRKLYTISAGTTVVWDEGNTTEYSSRSHWGSVYLRRYVQGNPSSTAHDALTHLGSGSQFYKTYNSASSNIRSFMFRSTNNDNSWSDNQQSTNIFRNVSGVTLFTYCGSATSEDTRWKLDWQVTTDGKKGASGKTIYFDDTYTSWKNTEAENREIYFNYGVDWSGGGYHRKIDFAVEKVPGTANLYKLKASSTDATNQGATNSSGQFGHDIYFQKWYVSKYYGYTNCNPITDSHVLERTEIYTDEIVSNDFTLIPTSKKSGGSGTDGSPYIWNTTKMTGHTHAVNIGSHTHGTITLSYTDESNTAQTPTESVNVAHTCIVSATATADNGYDYVSMTKGGAAYTPGTSHTVRDDVTFTATFTAHTYGITLNKGDHGAANQSATVDFDATGLKSVTHVSPNAGYLLEGYYDGSTKVLNADGSFAGENISGYITSGKWSKYNSDATLTAKFTPITFTVTFNANGGSGTMAEQDFTYDDTENLTANAFTKTGYYFEGWALTSGGDVAYRNRVDGCNISSDDGDEVELFAKWKAIADIVSDCWDGSTYKCSAITDLATPKPATTGTWNTVTWGGGTPDKNDQVVIPANMAMTVDVAHAEAKEILLGDKAKLEIDANQGLEVVGKITKEDGSMPTAADLTLKSSSAGNASLIFDNSDEDHLAAAIVEMYSKGTISGGTWNWQYVGTPYQGSKPLYNYYDSYMYKWNNTTSGWDVVRGDDEMEPFVGYCLTQDEATTHSMSGTLVPTTSHSVDIAVGKSMVLANSWTAPIYIGGFTASTFTSSPATIYLFNAGMSAGGASAAGVDKYAAGTYVAIPVNAGPYTGDEFIAPMQGFFVTTTGLSGAAGTITMNYADLVRPADSRGIVAGAMHAPKRNVVAEEGAPAVMKIWAEGTTYNDRVVILAREDFSTGFDNGWDGKKLSFSNEAPSVYVINEQGENEAVSAIPEFEGTVVGFRAGTGNDFSIRFEYNGEEELYLNDLKEQRSIRINTENIYTFIGLNTDNEARFIISATPINAPSIATGLNELNESANARKIMINNILYIIRGGQLYSTDGQIVK